MPRDKSYGILRIGRVTSTNAAKFRCDVSFAGKDGLGCATNPNPHFGVMPEVDSLVACYDHPGVGRRVIAVLDKVNGRTLDEMLVREDTPGYIPNMNDGETFIGGAGGGRAFFDDKGNALIGSNMYRAMLELHSGTATARLYGNNYDLYTQGYTARVHSASTVPGTWGDSLFMEVNFPLVPGASGAPLLPTTLGRVSIDKIGSLEMTALPWTARQTSLKISPFGSINLGRGIGTPLLTVNTVGLSIGVLDDISMFNLLGSLSVDKFGDVNVSSVPGLSKLHLDPLGGVSLLNKLGSVQINTLGQVSLSSPTANLELRADGSFGMYPNTSVWGTEINAIGDYTFVGKSADISVTTMARIAAIASINLASPLISLGLVPAGHVAFAEALITVFTQLNALNEIIKKHTHNVIVEVGLPSPLNATVLGFGVTKKMFGALPSVELNEAIIPAIPLPGALGSTTVTAQA